MNNDYFYFGNSRKIQRLVMNKDMEIFYKKALKKILNFKASEFSTVEFEQVKRNSEKLEVYRFVRRK
jgi:hypothetical protein